MSKKIGLFLIVVLIASLIPAFGAASAQDKVTITLVAHQHV